MAKLVIVALHGIGEKKADYYDDFERKLAKSLTKKNISSNDYIFHGIRYSEVFRGEADKIAEMTKGLNWQGFRQVISHSLGNALAYQAGVSTSKRIDFYKLVHQRIDNELHDLVEMTGIAEDTPILFVAHSLGAYIISNYIWDKQREFKNTSKLVEMGSLCGLITIGCNIPILTVGFDYNKLYPITLPGYGIEDNHAITWINIYSKNDLLALPMENFYSSDTPDQKNTLGKIQDVELLVGGFFVKYTPYSHTSYWNDKGFIEKTRNVISDLMQTLY